MISAAEQPPARRHRKVLLEERDRQYYRYLVRLISRLGPEGAIVFDAAFTELRAGVDEAAIEELVRRGDAQVIESAVPWDQLQAELAAIRPTLTRSAAIIGEYVAGSLAEEFGEPLTARQLEERIAKYAERHAAQLVTSATTETRAAVREIVTDALRDQRPAQLAAKAIRNVVGLNAQQAKSLDRYIQELRDEDLSAAQIQRAIDQRYRDMVKLRSETIAHTEVAAAANAGQGEAWAQARAEGKLPADVMQRWVLSAEPCEICEGISEEPIELGAEFVSQHDGSRHAAPPAHPRCRCGRTLWRPE